MPTGISRYASESAEAAESRRSCGSRGSRRSRGSRFRGPLMPGEPSTLLTNALYTTHAEITRGIVSPGNPMDSASALTSDQALARWSRDVRYAQYAFEWVSRLSFNTTTRTLTYSGNATSHQMPVPSYEATQASRIAAVKDVVDAAALRPDRMGEIVTQLSDRRRPTSRWCSTCNQDAIVTASS